MQHIEMTKEKEELLKKHRILLKLKKVEEIVMNSKEQIKAEDIYKKLVDFVNDYNIKSIKLSKDKEKEITTIRQLLVASRNILAGKKGWVYFEVDNISNDNLMKLDETLALKEGSYYIGHIYKENITLMNEMGIHEPCQLQSLYRKKYGVDDGFYNFENRTIVNIGYKNLNEFLQDVALDNSPIKMNVLCSYLQNDYGHQEQSMSEKLRYEFSEYISLSGIINLNEKVKRPSEENNTDKLLRKSPLYGRGKVQRNRPF